MFNKMSCGTTSYSQEGSECPMIVLVQVTIQVEPPIEFVFGWTNINTTWKNIYMFQIPKYHYLVSITTFF